MRQLLHSQCALTALCLLLVLLPVRRVHTLLAVTPTTHKRSREKVASRRVFPVAAMPPSSVSNHEQQPLNLDRTTSPLATAVRGEGYGAANNCTIPTAAQAASKVGVVPPVDATAATWKRAWNSLQLALPVLYAMDNTATPNSKLSLACLWWKALSANDLNSPVYDDGLTYDMLPAFTRVVVSRPLQRFYPRLHHATVEIRTAFLDQTVRRIVQEQTKSATTGQSRTRIRLISLGAGYDVRSIQLAQRGMIDHAVELDLPDVCTAKAFMLERLKRRRPLGDNVLPTLVPIDLNQVDHVQSVLEGILHHPADEQWHTIFLCEGVMIYLQTGMPAALLTACRAALDSTGSGSLVFADRLEDVPGGDYNIAGRELARHGWNLVDWQPKPGLARHMGWAELM